MDFGFGDVLAGSYCPERDLSNPDVGKIISCPISQYCQQPDQKLPCPKGYYCPHKTADFSKIKCSDCMAESEVFRKARLGNVLFFLALSIAILYLLYTLFTNYTSHGEKIRKKLERRKIEAAERKKLKEEERVRLLKIRPFLAKISKVLDTTKTNSAFEDDDRWLSFDVDNLFDQLDVNKDGVLSFDELNKVLKLKDSRLKQFIQRMNLMGEGDINNSSVTRDIFVANFMNVIHYSSNFDPTPDEVASLFDTIKNHQQHSKPASDGINIDELYDSELSFFLSDSQIYRIVTFFKERNEFIGELKEADPEQGTTTSTYRDPSSVETSTRNNLRYRYTLPMLTSSKGINFAMTMGRCYMMSKNVFIRLYPEALFYATHDLSLPEECDGVDIQFQDLSLYVNAGGISTAIVDKVTGRIKKKTMTVIMGCSSAGKTSLLKALCGRGKTKQFH